jgi:hypothetical protein
MIPNVTPEKETFQHSFKSLYNTGGFYFYRHFFKYQDLMPLSPSKSEPIFLELFQVVETGESELFCSNL